MTGFKKMLGDRGQSIAKKYLQKRGYKIKAENYCIKGGELDIVASFLDRIIFVEVKTRTTSQFGSGEEAVNYKKIESLIRTARTFLHQNNLQNVNFQIDLITVDFSDNRKKPEIRHLKNITS
ncbi:YraN family protein [Candidatus Parcubacteria bacterium]|nr:MAG: YraN family protein [Candidatus Parcubacteria bacterium]